MASCFIPAGRPAVCLGYCRVNESSTVCIVCPLLSSFLSGPRDILIRGSPSSFARVTLRLTHRDAISRSCIPYGINRGGTHESSIIQFVVRSVMPLAHLFIANARSSTHLAIYLGT